MPTGATPPRQPVSRYVTLAGREIHYLEWGTPGNPPVIMWHGLARTGHDFDTAAAALSDTYHVICPDTLGRGLSSWAQEPEQEYTVPFYVRQAQELIDALKFDQVRWVGTSMGGIIAMALAAGPYADRISHVLLNDIGPELDPEAVERIKTYVTDPPVVARITDLEKLFRTIYAPFGPLSDTEWRVLTESSSRRTRDGQFTLHYDPRVMRVFADEIDLFYMWDEYDRLSCKTHVFIGADTDLITRDTVERMKERGPKPDVELIPGCGHAPYLNTPDQLDSLRRFLAS